MITVKTQKGQANCPHCNATLCCRMGGEDGMILVKNGCTHVLSYNDGYYHGEETEIDFLEDHSNALKNATR